MIKQVIVMRTDLGMGKGKMVSQGAHASLNVLLEYFKLNPTVKPQGTIPMNHWMALESWLRGTHTKICVGVDTEEGLLELWQAARQVNLPTILITDAGKTMFHGKHTNTCIAIGPAKADEIDKITGKLKLL